MVEKHFYRIIRITYTSLSKSAFKVEKTKRIGNVKEKKDLKHKILQNSIEKIESTSVLSRDLPETLNFLLTSATCGSAKLP